LKEEGEGGNPPFSFSPPDLSAGRRGRGKEGKEEEMETVQGAYFGLLS